MSATGQRNGLSKWVLYLIILMFCVSFVGCDSGGGGQSANGDDDDDSEGDDDHSGDDDYYGDDDASDDDDYGDDDASGDDDDDWDDDDDPTGEEEPEYECPETTEDTVLYLSADDSNSMASPVVARAIIEQGQIVPAGLVRTWEFTNYYQIDYDTDFTGPLDIVPQMKAREDSEFDIEYTLQIGVQGKKVAQAQRRPMNITFSLDTSGSMSGTSIALLKDVCRAIAGQLKDGDLVSMVEWDSTTNVVLESLNVDGPNDPTLLGAINGLTAGSSTDLHGGLVRAYQLAEQNYNENRINRVILISDGGANTGVTDIDIISQAADDSETEGIYMVGVGVGDAFYYYNDELMESITDAGKGAYLFVDSTAEANRQFGERFIENLEIAAMDVRVELAMPYYLIMSEFHGEEYSPNPEEVEPQHLAPNDAMVYHQYLVACDAGLVDSSDIITVRADYIHPTTREELSDIRGLSIGELLAESYEQLAKGDAVVTFAEALKKIATFINTEPEKAMAEFQQAQTKIDAAYVLLGDGELLEIKELMETYQATLAAYTK